jgi:PIN domain nuclease of toxin-antitoxin system
LHWSAASSWELAIKAGLGRLDLAEPARTLIPRVLFEQAIRPIDVTHAHALAVADLPPLHRDPFDRLLIAQARIERLAILSADRVFARYGAEVVW